MSRLKELQRHKRLLFQRLRDTDWPESARLIEEILDAHAGGLQRGEVTELINAYGRAKHSAGALELFHTVPLNRRDGPLYAAAARALYRQYRWERALRLLGEAKGTEVDSDRRVVVAKVASLDRGFAWREALRVAQGAKAADAGVWNAAAGACGRVHQWARSLGVLVAMRRSRVPPDGSTTGVILSVLRTAKQHKVASTFQTSLRSSPS
eukprot:Hpha_TRINITY_DN9488_c0_g1::TRINITY_DN9488_c0_g1_i2::g.139168::m.139168